MWHLVDRIGGGVGGQVGGQRVVGGQGGGQVGGRVPHVLHTEATGLRGTLNTNR